MRPILRAPDPNPEGISELDWVRKVGCRGVGKVERVTDNMALVTWLNGRHSVLPCVWLKRVENRDCDGKVGE